MVKMSGINLLKYKSGIYRCPDNINNIQIRIKLSKYKCNQLMKANESELTEPIMITWQQKLFNKYEMEYYSKSEHCVTDMERKYYEIINTQSYQPLLPIFTYIHADNYQPDDSITTDSNKSTLYQQTSKAIKTEEESVDSSEYNFRKSLLQNLLHSYSINAYENMYIMFDLNYIRNKSTTNVHLKNEYSLLCTLKYDATKKVLWTYPDFSKNSYVLELDSDEGKFFFEYSIENYSNMKPTELEKRQEVILKKITEHRHKLNMLSFEKEFEILNSRNRLRTYIFLEILTARHFEYDNLYIEYHFELPNGWLNGGNNEQPLFGRTQISKVKGNENVAHFGCYIDVCLDFDATLNHNNQNEIFPLPCIYFQILSKDNWNRYRIEGFTYKYIQIWLTGTQHCQLYCARIASKNCTGVLQRYFIGDYSNVDDIKSWIAIPKGYESNVINKYGVPTQSTGIVDIRLNIMNQISNDTSLFKLNSNNSKTNKCQLKTHCAGDSVVKSLNDVLEAFNVARKKMLRARQQLITEKNN